MNIIIVVVVVTLALAMQSPAKAEYKWQHFGAAPYASSRAEAMQTRQVAFQKLGFPKQVVALLMEATKQPGEKSLITVGDRLSAMISKKGIVHHDVLVDFGSPVPHMQYAAPAERWQVSWHGSLYTVILPEICGNWSSIAPSSEACVTVEYLVQPGDETRFAVLAQKRLPSSACWQLCDGSDCAAPPSPCDECDWIGPKSVIPAGFEPIHTGRYVAQSAKQTLRFPREVENDYLALCVDREGLGESDSWIVQPSKWKNGTTRVIVPYGGQEWPAWGQFDLSKWHSAN